MATNIFYSNAFSSKIKRRLSFITHSFYLDRDPDYRRSILISGAGRSGTTWLADVLNAKNQYRLLYEPFNRAHVPQCRHFLARQYIRPDDQDPSYVAPARAIFTGRIRNAWIDQYTRPIIARQRLIKDVRSTLMLKWVRQLFPGMPIIFLIRHPCAVAVSRVKLGWRTDLREIYFQQQSLMVDHLEPLAEHITDASSPFERHIVDWCVENYVPFAQLDHGDVFLAFYEHLCMNPKEELERLFRFLQRTFDESVLDGLHKPSPTSRKGEASSTTTKRNIEGWREYVSASDLAAARRIIAAFGLDQIYGPNSLADVESANKLLAKGSARMTGRTAL